MFSEVSVSHSVHGRGVVGYLWSHVHSGGRVSLVPSPFQGIGYRVGGRVSGMYTLPPQKNRTKAGGTDPTGMFSCSVYL